jgi:hypothetical protein
MRQYRCVPTIPDLASQVHTSDESPKAEGKSRDVVMLGVVVGMCHTPIPEMDRLLRAPKKPSTSPSTEKFPPPPPPHGPYFLPVVVLKPMLVTLLPVAVPNTRITLALLPLRKGTSQSGLLGKDSAQHYFPFLQEQTRQPLND